MRYSPHEYQRFVIDYIKKNPIAAVFLDMGLGKTSITLTALNDLLFDSFDVHRILVVAPLRVARNTWSSEIRKWEHLQDLQYSIVVGTEKERMSALEKKADIYIINRENAQMELESFALLFEFDGDQRHIRHVLYNCAASRPGIEGKTNEDTREVQTETLTIKATPLSSGLVKAKTGNTTDTTVYNDWYKAVYMPTVTESDEGEGVA